MPPRKRKVIEDDEDEILTNNTTREETEKVSDNRKGEKKGGIKRKIVESSDDDSSEDDSDERLELTDEDDIESLSSADSQLEQDENDEEMEDLPQYNRLMEIEKAILDKLEGKSCDQQLIIHSIEMKNFKSYKDNTMVGPFISGLNCICGSNGSGKSNIIDSICFVLGFESKELRAKNLDYLINDQCSPDEESYVKINFNVIDRSRNDCSKQFSIQRKMKRNDHTSTYHIFSPNEDSRKISKKQVRELLNEYGIDFDYPDRFIVMQHNTIKMVKQNPLEMLFHLEKLFGTDRVQVEIKQVQEDMTNLRSDIQLHEKEKNDCEKEMELLKPAVEHYQNFQRLERKVEEIKASIKESELKCLTFKLDQSKKELKAISSEISSIESSRSKSQQEVQKLKESIKQHVEKIDIIDKEMDQLKKTTSKVQKSLLKIRLENDSYNQKVKHFENELEQNSNNSIQLVDEKEDLNIKISNGDVEIQDLENSINNDRMEISRLTSNIDDNSQKVLLDLQRDLSEIISSHHYTSFTSRYGKSKDLEDHIEHLNQTLSNTQEEKLALESSLEEIAKLKKLADSEVSTLEENFKRVQESIDSKKRQIIKIEDEIFELETASVQKEEASTTFLDTIKKIRSGFDGSFGTIPEIYRICDQKFSVCVNSVLQPYLTNTVVVSSREVALKVVKIFETNRAGLVSCEILNELKPMTLQTNQTTAELKPLIEVLECEPQYRNLLEKHTQGWFIANSIDCAMKYSYHNGIRRNIVTIDGKVFKSFGEISCHFSKDTSSHLISTQYSKFNATSTDNNKDIERLSVLKNNHQGLQENCENLTFSLSDIKQSISEKEVVSRNYQSQIKKLGTSLSTLSRKLVSLQKELEIKQEEFNATVLTQTEESSLSKLEEKRKELEMKIDSIECIDNNGNSLSILKKTLSEKQKTFADLKHINEKQRKRLTQISSLLSNLFVHREQYKNELEQFRKENNQEELISLESEFSTLKKQKGNLESKKETYCNTLKEFRRDLKKSSQIINDNDLQISSKIQEREKIQENIEVIRLSISKMSHCDIQLDKKFDLEFEEKRQLKLLSELKHTSTELDSMKDSIDENCLEKQSATRKKLVFTNKKLDSIKQRIESLEQLESKFLSLRYDLFHKIISKINENLSQIFRDLNNNSNCYISYYEDKKTLFEKGVNIYCKYEMEWKEFNKLSGGQKNLVCSVLSIALMRCFSTSICIFDELCSSLDTINVEKLAKLIKSSSLNTQFICISFKFYEKADNIIGVYHQNGVSCTVPFSNK